MSMPLSRDPIVAKDYPNAKLLYTILKQFELRHVDWDRVAAELEISNGHAARMRFTRFKQEMEGIRPTHRRISNSSRVNKEVRPRGRPPGRKNKAKCNETITPIAADEKRPEDITNGMGKKSIKHRASSSVKEDYSSEFDTRSTILKTSTKCSEADMVESAKDLKTEKGEEQTICSPFEVLGEEQSPILIPDDSYQANSVNLGLQPTFQGISSLGSSFQATDAARQPMGPILHMIDPESQLLDNVIISPSFNSQWGNYGMRSLQPVSQFGNHYMSAVDSNFNFEHYGSLGTTPWDDEMDAHFDLYDDEYKSSGA